MDKQHKLASLTREVEQRDRVIERQGKKIDRYKSVVTKLAGTLIAFSLLVIVYMALELLK